MSTLLLITLLFSPVIRYKIKPGFLLGCLFLLCPFCPAFAQTSTCPENIDFEFGGFNNWKAFTGTTQTADGENKITVTETVATADRHVILKDDVTTDPYGNFVISAPDDSHHIVKLGNSSVGAQAERLSYEFTVPSGQADFVITYQYAVVFEDPGHPEVEQPRFTAKVFDITDNSYIECVSFEYIATAALPGFQVGAGNVLYKDWTPASLNLADYKGHQLRLEFTTADCTVGGHFGYAYVDVNNNCAELIQGNYYCAEATTLTLHGPDSFKEYSWYNADHTELLGHGLDFTISTANMDDKTITLDLVPYEGFGCPYTTRTTLHSYAPIIFDVKDMEICYPNTINLQQAILPSGSSDLTYTYWIDAAGTQPVSNFKAVDKNGIYYIKATAASECIVIKPVKVTINLYPVLKINNPKKVYQPEKVDLTKPLVTGGSEKGLIYTYWTDADATQVLNNPDKIAVTGIYYIKGTTLQGCNTVKAVEVTIAKVPQIMVPTAFTPTKYENNRLYPFLIGVPDFKIFRVFNRWGEVVYQSSGSIPSEGWDGYYKGAIQFLDTYSWYAEGYDEIGNFVHRSGNTLLLN